MAALAGFPPLARPDARLLVLGSMPGERSLAAGQYYAHPANAFWPIVGGFTGCPADRPYAERVAALLAAGIAVWDVLAACERQGSLDAAIVPASMRPNDFAGFFAAQPRLAAVLCNGGTAFRLWRRLGAPQLGAGAAALPVQQLPSTSPAHASRSLAAKRRQWHAALRRALAQPG